MTALQIISVVVFFAALALCVASVWLLERAQDLLDEADLLLAEARRIASES